MLDTGVEETRMTCLYRLERFSCGYGSKKVIDDISCSIEKGAITALIGPNGSGKSTLLRALGGLSRYEGELSLMGRPVRNIARGEFGKNVGFLRQGISVKAEFSVWEIVSMGRLPFHRPLEPMTKDDDRIVLESAKLAGISHLLFRRASELSGGECQRVLFAVTLAQRPELFLLDEPTSALDPNHTRHIFSLLTKMTREGKSVIAAVHDLNSAISSCDSFIALKDGHIAAQGPIGSLNEEILEKLYGIPFCRYLSKEGNTAWLPQ